MSIEIIEKRPVISLVDDAVAALDGYRDAMLDRIKQLESQNEFEKTSETTSQIQGLNKVLSVAVDMTRKMQDVRDSETGGGGLDLDDARLEIGSRLARLRAARDADSVSGRVD